MSCFLGVLSLPLAVWEEVEVYAWWAFPGELFPAGKQAAEQGKAPGFLLRSLKSMWFLLQGVWLPSQCLGSLLPLSCCAQQAEKGTLVPLPSAPCAGQMGQALTFCISLSLQMARPIQVKPADSESRGGSCHLSLFLLWLCACEGDQAKRQGPDLAFLSLQSV